MILYGAPGACSQASHIALIEAGLSHQYARVGRDKRTDNGKDFLAINPKGYHPALELDDGSVLTESLVILMYIAAQSGKLLATDGPERWRTLQALEFMTAEIHCNFRPFFGSEASEGEKEKGARNLTRRFATLDEQLGDGPFLMGERMTIADPYLFVMVSWAVMKGVPVPERLAAFAKRMRAVPSVVKTLDVEGLG